MKRNKEKEHQERQERKKLRKEQKDRKEKREAEKRAALPSGKLQIGSYLHCRVADAPHKVSKSRYFALYSGSSAIFKFVSFDDAPGNPVVSIPLSPCTTSELLPHGDKGEAWEFLIRPSEDEKALLFSSDDEGLVRKWLMLLDNRTQSPGDLQQSEQLLISLHEKADRLREEIADTKQRLKLSYDNPDSADSKRLEELMIALQYLTASIQMMGE